MNIIRIKVNFVLALLIVLAIGGEMFPKTVYADSAVLAELDGTANAGPGDSVVFSLKVSGTPQDLLLKQMTLVFDPDELSFIAVDELPDRRTFAFETIGPGNIRIKIDGGQALNDGIWQSLLLKALPLAQAVTSSVEVRDLVVMDSGGEAVEVNGASTKVQLSPVDGAALQALLEAARILYETSQEGNEIGHYAASSKALLLAAINLAETAGKTSDSDALKIEWETLYAARQTFLNSVLTDELLSSGDLNGDGGITVGDLAIAAAFLGKKEGDWDWSEFKKADLNDDGIVDLDDLIILARMIIIR